MDESYRISTGIDGLDQTLDYLRPSDNVTWQIESIGDYAFVATVDYNLRGSVERMDLAVRDLSSALREISRRAGGKQQ